MKHRCFQMSTTKAAVTQRLIRAIDCCACIKPSGELIL